MTDLRILGVHGVNNYQPGLAPSGAASRLANWWASALLDHDPRVPGTVKLDVAYYAHHLGPVVPQGDDDVSLLEPQIQQDILKWVSQLAMPSEAPQGRLTAPARAAVDWVATRFGLDHRLVRIFVTVFFREVYRYFDEPGSRRASVTEIAAAIERTRPQVIIAHSLGSVVAYETLWAQPHPRVELLLTLGSPLAMPDIVYSRLAAHPGGRSRPPGVARWINVSDPGDFVAIPRGGIPRKFEHVTADLTDAIGAFDFHRVTKYLACGATKGVISAYL